MALMITTPCPGTIAEYPPSRTPRSFLDQMSRTAIAPNCSGSREDQDTLTFLASEAVFHSATANAPSLNGLAMTCAPLFGVGVRVRARMKDEG